MNRININLVAIVIIFLFLSCNTNKTISQINLIDSNRFERMIDDKQVKIYTLRNANGAVAQFTNFGGRWISMWVPDKEGKMTDVVLGFGDLESYINAGEPYHGAITGRICGRINNGKFTLNGTDILLRIMMVLVNLLKITYMVGLWAFTDRSGSANFLKLKTMKKESCFGIILRMERKAFRATLKFWLHTFLQIIMKCVLNTKQLPISVQLSI